jgi:hypothetical protein
VWVDTAQHLARNEGDAYRRIRQNLTSRLGIRIFASSDVSGCKFATDAISKSVMLASLRSLPEHITFFKSC